MKPLGDPDEAFRRSHIGAAEVACLFGANPWLSLFELWHRKAGNVPEPTFGDNERAEWGLRLEPVIYEAAVDEWGYSPREAVANLSNGRGLGGHPDRRAICPERGPGIVEIKTVDAQQRGKWGDEPPLGYLLQTQVYCGLDNVQWTDIVVLVGGNHLERFEYDFRPKLFAEIEKRVEDFWSSVRAGDPPAPTGDDVPVLLKVLGPATDETVDLSGDNYADQLVRDFLTAKAQVSEWSERADSAKAELLMKIGAAGRANLPAHFIACGMTKGTPGKLITADQVGTYAGARAPYRRFDVREALG